MLNFSRLSRRTHRIVNALISCQYCVTGIPYVVSASGTDSVIARPVWAMNTSSSRGR